MIPIQRYLLEKIAADYTQDGPGDSRPDIMKTHEAPVTPKNLSNTQLDYMMNARDRIDEMQRYHQGAIHYDKDKYTSDQWADYVRGLTNDPMYAKVTAQGVTDEQLKQYQIDMANKSLNNFRQRYESVDPTHPMVADSQAITGAYDFDNYQWQTAKDYRQERGLETTMLKGTTIPVMKNRLSEDDGGYSWVEEMHNGINSNARSKDFINRYKRKDTPKANTLRAVNNNGTQVTRQFDANGNYTDNTEKVNLPKPMTNAQWDVFKSGKPRPTPQLTPEQRALENRNMFNGVYYQPDPNYGMLQVAPQFKGMRYIDALHAYNQDLVNQGRSDQVYAPGSEYSPLLTSPNFGSQRYRYSPNYDINNFKAAQKNRANLQRDLKQVNKPLNNIAEWWKTRNNKLTGGFNSSFKKGYKNIFKGF